MGYDEEEILTVYDVACFLKISMTNTYKLLKSKDIPAMRIGNQYRVVKSEFLEWIRNNADSKFKIK